MKKVLTLIEYQMHFSIWLFDLDFGGFPFYYWLWVKCLSIEFRLLTFDIELKPQNRQKFCNSNPGRIIREIQIFASLFTNKISVRVNQIVQAKIDGPESPAKDQD